MDRRSFLKTAAVAGAAVTAAGATGAIAAPVASAAPSPSPLTPLYRNLVPEIFAPLADAPAFTDAVVIGSGFGGAIAAHRLAQAGVQVTVLERGSRWPRDPRRNIFPTDLTPDGRGVWHRTSITGVSGITQPVDDFGGVLDMTEYANLQVWRGAGVGGGSLVYTGVMIEPERRFFDRVFAGTGVGYDEMHNTFYPRVRSNLLLSTVPDDVYGHQSMHHSRLWDQQVRKAGYDPQLIEGIWNWTVVRDEIRGASNPSATIGCTNLGNSNGAKFDLTQNYLKWAEESGKARIYPGHQVLSIGRESSGRYTIDVQKVDPNGIVLSTRTITANKIFFGAGSVGTTELLLQARETRALPNLNEHIGEGFGSNGDAAVVRKWSGGGLTQGAPSRSRIVDESGMPVTLENWLVPGPIVDIGLIGSLGMVLDDTRGRYVYNRATNRTELQWPGQPDADAALRAVQNKIADANGLSVGFLPLAKDVNSKFTAHPLGGAVIGKATDGFGRVTGYDGLYVVDSALIPGSTGTVNPSLTISALAERNLDAIIREGK